jgi:hypothetical protein
VTSTSGPLPRTPRGSPGPASIRASRAGNRPDPPCRPQAEQARALRFPGFFCARRTRVRAPPRPRVPPPQAEVLRPAGGRRARARSPRPRPVRRAGPAPPARRLPPCPSASRPRGTCVGADRRPAGALRPAGSRASAVGSGGRAGVRPLR